MVSNSICPGSPRANRSLLIALDPARAQAPVWRENFSSADTTKSGQLSADSTPGNKRDFRSRGEKRQQLRINAGCVGTAALGCPDYQVLNENALSSRRLDWTARASASESVTTEFRS